MCNITFSDPTPFLLQQARELMFRTAIAQGNSSTIQVIEPASEARTASIYRTHYEYMGGAVAVNILAVLVVLVAFRGYWYVLCPLLLYRGMVFANKKRTGISADKSPCLPSKSQKLSTRRS